MPRLTDCLESWLDILRAENKSGETLKGYGGDVRRLLRFLAPKDPEGVRVRAFTQMAVRAWFRWQAGALSPKTRARELSVLRQFAAWLRRHGHLHDDPTAEITRPQIPKGLPRALPADDIGRWLDQSRTTTALDRRDRAMMELLFSAGIRIGECAALDVGDVDLERQLVHVRHGKGNRARIIPIGAGAVDAVRTWLVDRAAWLARGRGQRMPEALWLSSIGQRRLTRAGAMQAVERWGRLVGAPREFTAHVFRHSCATAMLEGGADLRDVQEQLGHASPATTALYTHVTIGRLRRVHATAHPRAGPGPGPAERGRTAPETTRYPVASDVARMLHALTTGAPADLLAGRRPEPKRLTKLVVEQGAQRDAKDQGDPSEVEEIRVAPAAFEPRDGGPVDAGFCGERLLRKPSTHAGRTHADAHPAQVGFFSPRHGNGPSS